MDLKKAYLTDEQVHSICMLKDAYLKNGYNIEAMPEKFSYLVDLFENVQVVGYWGTGINFRVTRWIDTHSWNWSLERFIPHKLFFVLRPVVHPILSAWEIAKNLFILKYYPMTLYIPTFEEVEDLLYEKFFDDSHDPCWDIDIADIDDGYSHSKYDCIRCGGGGCVHCRPSWFI